MRELTKNEIEQVSGGQEPDYAAYSAMCAAIALGLATLAAAPISGPVGITLGIGSGIWGTASIGFGGLAAYGGSSEGMEYIH